MNTLIKLDEWLLNVAKGISRKIYNWIGVDSLCLGNLCICIGTIIRILVIGISFKNDSDNYDHFQYDLSLLILGIVTGFFVVLSLKKDETENGCETENVRRDSIQIMRIFWLVLTLLFVLLFFFKDITEINLLRIVSSCFVFVFAIYFFSINSEECQERASA